HLPPHGCPTFGASLPPLIPLACRLEVWLSLPNPSCWLIRTVRLGYAIQFRGILFTSVHSDTDASVLHAEIAVLLAKNATKPVPPAEMKLGFYSPYFIIPKKNGGLRSILDLCVLNRSLLKMPFKMLTLKRIISCIRHQDWFTAIDLKDAYFQVSILPRHKPFLRFAYEGRAYQYKVLPFGQGMGIRSQRTSTAVAHQLLRVAGRVSRASSVPSDVARGTCACPHGQHGDGHLYQSPRGFGFPSHAVHVATYPPSPPLESEVAQIATCHSHSRRAEPCSRCTLTPAYSPWRMKASSPSGPAYLEPIRGSSDRSVCLSRIRPLPVVLLPDRGSPRHGCPGTQLAPGSNQVHLSPSEPPCTELVQDPGGRGVGLAGCALLAHPDLVPGTHAPLEDSTEEGPSFSGDGHYLAPAPRSVEPSRVASGRDAADLSGLPQAVIDTITQAKASSTRQAYALRWGLFVDWCSSHQEDPQRCSFGVVLSFLQEKLERRLSPSTLKIYVAAIAPYHDAVDGPSLGRHHLIVRFLRGARRLNPPRSHLIPSWDLSVVLTGLRKDPFEPLESVELKYLSLKTSLLIALTSIGRVGQLDAFSVNESCLEFGPADSHAHLRPRPGYVPKVPTTPFRDQVVNLQALPLEEADTALGLLCPVHALRIYVDRTRSFRRSEQLFVCFGGQQKGNAVSKQRLAHWVVDAITLAYQCQGEPCPLGVRAHATRSVASSYALAHGASLADICRAAGWVTPNTFARFYNLR
ncbi:hypothetical protein M9458_008617, partial [Cirrhinus mrigala]